MDIRKATEYIELLEENLNLMQRRHESMQKVQDNYGKHNADNYLRNIDELNVLIEENNQKLKNIKEDKN